MDRYELRRLDYSLTEDHKDLRRPTGNCWIATVRSKWSGPRRNPASTRACGNDCVPWVHPRWRWRGRGGDGATLVDLTLVAEELGRVLAPVPWIDHVCAARLLERLGAADDEVVTGSRIVGLDPRLDASSGAAAVPAGSVADAIVVRDGDQVVQLSFATRPERVANLGQLPMAWVDPAAADTHDRAGLRSGGAGGLRPGARRVAAADCGGPDRSGRADDDHRGGVRQIALHPRGTDRDAAGDFASAGQYRDRRAGRPEPGAPGGLVPGQRTRRTTRVGRLRIRLHGRRGVQSGDDGRPRPGRARCLRGGGGDCVPGAGQGLATGRWRPRSPRPPHRGEILAAREPIQEA